MTCDIPQGLEMELIVELGVTEEADPAQWPPDLRAIFENPTRAIAGMVCELIVVAPEAAEPVPEAGFPPGPQASRLG